MKKVKKLVALLLSFCMMISVVPMDTLAAGTTVVMSEDAADDPTEAKGTAPEQNAENELSRFSDVTVETDENTQIPMNGVNNTAVALGESTGNVISIERQGEETKYFTSVYDAHEVMNDGDKVTLLADIDQQLPISKSVTLDLNGHNVCSASSSLYIDNLAEVKIINGSINVTGMSSKCYAIELDAASKATVCDGVTIVAGGVSFAVNGEAATLVVDGGYIDGKVKVSYLTINGGTFTKSVSSNGELNVTGGTFNNALTISDNFQISGGTFSNVVIQSRASGTISGGIFDNALTIDGTVRISGGKFAEAAKPAEEIIDSDYCLSLGNDGYYSVEKAFATVENVKDGCGQHRFADFIQAHDARKDNDSVIKLVGDGSYTYTLQANETLIIDDQSETGAVQVSSKAAYSLNTEINGTRTAYTQSLIAPTITTADETNKVYDGTPITLTANTDAEAPVYQWYKDGAAVEGAVSKTLELKNVSDSGSYTVKISADGNDASSAAATEVSISRRNATVTPDEKFKNYGEADPMLTYTATGLVDGEELENITVTRVAGDNVGSYELTASQPEGANPNYNVTFVPGKLFKIFNAIAKIGDMGYDSLDAAIAAASAGQEVTLLQNITVTSSVLVYNGITLNLNGKTIKLNSEDESVVLYLMDDNVTVKNGTVTSAQNYYYDSIEEDYCYNYGIYNYGSNAVIENVAITGVGYGVCVEAGSVEMRGTATVNVESTGVYIYNGAHFTLGSGTVASDNIGVWNEGQFTMNSGSVTVADYGVYNEGQFTMNGGTVTVSNVENGVGVYNVGQAALNSGKINSEYIAVDAEYGSTVTVSGGHIFAKKWAVYLKGAAFEMTGGSLESEAYGIVPFIEDATSTLSTVTISGGSLKAATQIFANATQAAWNVTGGIYSALPSDYMINHIIESRYTFDDNTDEATKNEYPYVVVELTVANAVAEITRGGVTIPFASIYDAMSSSVNGDTITLLQDTVIDSNIYLSDGRELTLDLNGKNIECKNSGFHLLSYGEYLGGKLTVEGEGSISSIQGSASIFYFEGTDTADGTGKCEVVIGENVTIKDGVNSIWFGTSGGRTGCYNASIDIYGTVSGAQPIFVHGVTQGTEANAPKIRICGTARIECTEGTGIYLAGYAITTVEAGAELTSDANVISIAAGELIVNGGTFVGGNEISYDEGGNGSIDFERGSAIFVKQHTTNLPLKVTINDGEFKAAKPINQATGRSGASAAVEKVELLINGGKFFSTYTGEEVADIICSADKKEFIRAGYFSKVPDASYLEEDKVVVENMEENKNVYPYKIGDAAARVGGVSYRTLQEAVDAASDGQTIRVFSANNEEITINKAIVITGAECSGLTAGTHYNLTASDTTYTFTAKEYLVTVKNDGDTPIGNLTGGGYYTYGTEATITASDQEGYTFAGWYVEGVQVSSQNTYQFTVDGDITLVAKYTALETAKLTLTVDASRFTITGKNATQKGYQTYRIAVGSSVTVKYTDANYKFLYWANESEKVVSKNPEYTFILGSNTALHAVYAEKEAGTDALIVFLSAYDQIIQAQTCTEEDAIEFPDVIPSKVGYVFDKWVFEGSTTEATAEAIKAAIAENSIIKVVPSYISNGDKYQITVKYSLLNGQPELISTEEVPVGDRRDITAADTYLEAKFLYWTDAAGNILSHNKKYPVISTTDVELIAVYGDEGEAEETATAVITGVTRNEMISANGETYYRVSFTEYFSIPTGCTLVSTGFVRVRDASAATEDNMTLNGQGILVYKSIHTAPDTQGIYIYNINTYSSTTVHYMRAYVQYTDAEGVIRTVYSDIASASYAGLQEQQ